MTELKTSAESCRRAATTTQVGRRRPGAFHDQRWTTSAIIVIGLLWPVSISFLGKAHEADGGARRAVSLDWADIALRARAAQSPTMSNSPAR